MKKHVDTGLGLERISMVMQNKKSSYDTDIFEPIIKEISEFSNKEYGKDEKTDIAIRVIADHIRAISLS
ncbi:MAG: alanine--tRNA ligase-related protein, partial [Cytophagales bacterium]